MIKKNKRGRITNVTLKKEELIFNPDKILFVRIKGRNK